MEQRYQGRWTDAFPGSKPTLGSPWDRFGSPILFWEDFVFYNRVLCRFGDTLTDSKIRDSLQLPNMGVLKIK